MIAIKQGDEVRLKSGGPMMTVSSVEEDEAVCIWFEGSKQSTSRFNLAVLVNKTDIPRPPEMSIGGILL